MSSSRRKFHFSILIFFSLTILVHARLNLSRSDFDALSNFINELGFNSQPNSPENLCNSRGIFCEPRISENSSPELRVIRILLPSQKLNGFFSPAIGRLSELKELSLPNNHLSHQIPIEIVDCRKLEILNLRNNQFSGEVPSEFSSLVSLRSLDLSSNRFSGNLNFLKYFPNLETLSLSDNHFTGKIPTSLRSFHNLRFLNLSGNTDIQGSVPMLINQLESKTDNTLPKRYKFAENATASEIDSPEAQAPAPAPSTSDSEARIKKQKKKRKAKEWILGFLVGGVAGIFCGLTFSSLFKVIMVCIRGRGKDTGPVIYSSMIKAQNIAFLEKEDGLASLEIIGRGGCGEVYKAELPESNGKIVAIKKIIQPSMDATELNEEDSRFLTKKMRQIRSEIQTVGQIRHRNLLSLLAHVTRPDCYYLIYEFMKNGSLQDVLNQVSEGTRELDWLIRHRIALGIAAGLEYLHMHHSPRIIHRDLKPANILLDDDMEARIADFGLAKAVPDANTHVTTSNVAGTVGFIAPEYHQMLKFTDKCDIYSFGVLLAVMVMGKLPSDEFFQETDEMYQIKWLRNVMQSETPTRAIDPKLIGNGYEEQMLLVLKIACFCTMDDPKQRPNSKDVNRMLSQIEH